MRNHYETALILNAWTLPSNIRHEVIFHVLDVLPLQHSVTLIKKSLFAQC